MPHGRGGIRTHAGLHPHDFQSCALSHSATRPDSTLGKPGPSCGETEGVGFEPTRAFRPNALAGRRLKPLGHPSLELPLLGSNQDSPDPESGVLPITPRGKILRRRGPA